MNTTELGFIGGGRVTRLILEGLRRAGLPLAGVAVSDRDAAARERLAALDAGIALSPEARDAASRPVVVLALHPPAMKEALPALAPLLRADAVVVSLAPVLGFAQLSALLAGRTRLARAIPNAPSTIGQGYNPVAFGPGLDGAGRERVRELLAPLGQHPEVDEARLEAYAVLTAMGPTYFWSQWQALRELGGAFGLTPAATDEALGAMLRGATSMLLETGLPFAAVEDTVAVKPMAEVTPEFVAQLRTRLTALHAKLTGR